MRNSTALLVAFALMSAPIVAQEQLGLRLETYAGASSLPLNPTGNLDNPLKWDLNLTGVGIFLENNYAFLRETSVRRLYLHRNDAVFITAEEKEGPTAPNEFVVDFFDNAAKRFVVSENLLMGPSLALRLGEQHSVGIFMNIRGEGGSVNIPNQFSYYKYDARPFNDGFEIPKLQAALMGWQEVGINYAFKTSIHKGEMSFGMNLKFLKATTGAFLETLSPYQHTKQPGNVITVGLPDSRYGFDQSGRYRNNLLVEQEAGNGLGIDLGFSFQGNDSKLKLGASLLDLGRIKFDNDAEAHRLDLDSTIVVDFDDYDQFDSQYDIEAIVDNFSQNSLNDPLATLEGNSFKMALPAALSLQADYGFTANLYLNALLLQRLPSLNPGPKRGNLLAVTPRWQHRWYSVSAPLSIYNWSQVHVGLAARLGWLVIGSDDLAGLFFDKNLTGADFYFALKVNPFEIGKVRKRERGNGKKRFGGKGDVKCYKF